MSQALRALVSACLLLSILAACGEAAPQLDPADSMDTGLEPVTVPPKPTLPSSELPTPTRRRSDTPTPTRERCRGQAKRLLMLQGSASTVTRVPLRNRTFLRTRLSPTGQRGAGPLCELSLRPWRSKRFRRKRLYGVSVGRRGWSKLWRNSSRTIPTITSGLGTCRAGMSWSGFGPGFRPGRRPCWRSSATPITSRSGWRSTTAILPRTGVAPKSPPRASLWNRKGRGLGFWNKRTLLGDTDPRHHNHVRGIKYHVRLQEVTPRRPRQWERTGPCPAGPAPRGVPLSIGRRPARCGRLPAGPRWGGWWVDVGRANLLCDPSASCP